MEPIELLMTEHRLIERGLDAMNGWLTALSPETDSDDKEELARFVSFIRGFADAYHHGKEEDILFVAMVDHGFPRDVGPIPVMLREHDQGRSLVSVLEGLAKQPVTWSEQDRDTLARTVREFSASPTHPKGRPDPLPNGGHATARARQRRNVPTIPSVRRTAEQ
jgi:hemerythrin-like domain-containing protein